MLTWFWLKPPSFSYVNDALHIVVSRKLCTKSSDVSIKSRSMPASLSFKGQATKHTTTKWSAEKFCSQSLVITSSYNRFIIIKNKPNI